MISKTERKSLIDDWFPVVETSVESVRERSASSALPPLYYLHVWFARRPLVASRAAILGSILPSNTPRENVLRLLGIPIGVDLRKAQRELDRAKSAKTRLRENPFKWDRAYKHTPTRQELVILSEILKRAWDTDRLTILDPMAGGGSIPYEAIRLGQSVIAGDLNPVAYICLKGTVEYPARFKERLLEAVSTFCSDVHIQAKLELEEFFPQGALEHVYGYLWARTIICPSCHLQMPLSPNWWIVQTDDERIAVELSIPKGEDRCCFKIVKEDKIEFDPENGSVRGGDAVCPRCKAVTDGTYIKKEAKAGRMGHQLYAVITKITEGKKREWSFRTATEHDVESFEKAKRRLQEKLGQWEKMGLVPIEAVPEGLKTREPLNFGMPRWCDLFNPRQLFTHLTYLEKFQDAKSELFKGKKEGTEEWEFETAVAVYGAMVFDTCINYNSMQSRWDGSRGIRGSMDMQAFPFRWSYAEWNQIVENAGYEWALTKVIASLRELVKLVPAITGPISVYQGTATKIPLDEKSVNCIVVDPPYAENVMYAEVSDFFYVWLKRLLGDVFPSAFRDELTEKNEEVVSNPARYRGYKQGAKVAARQDYALKMEACFREMYRVLKDDGVMTVMFTHREVEAWSGLAIALMRAGYTFRASWPVHTEPGEKFGKMDRGVLKVTVLLACRKRQSQKPGVWEHVRDELRELARDKIEEFSKLGIEGADLRVSVYGPILGKFADYYPMKTATGKEIEPTEALNLVVDVLNERFLKEANVQGADKETGAYLNLLSTFPKGLADYDEARLATVFGGLVTLDSLDVKGDSKLVRKEKGKVILLSARERMAAGLLNPNEAKSLRYMIDLVHASVLLYEKKGVQNVKDLIRLRNLDIQGSPFISVLEAYTRYADASENESFRKDAAIAKPLLAALGSSASFTKKKGESLDHFASDS